MLSSGDILYGNGRNKISEIIIRGIKQKPWTGYGMAGDRLFGVVYAHNLALELCVSYGIPIGGSILVGIVLLIINKLYRDEENGYLILILACGNGFSKLCFSSSYLLEYLFFFMIGLCISSGKTIKQDSFARTEGLTESLRVHSQQIAA